jgi:hypothetical protein
MLIFLSNSGFIAGLYKFGIYDLSEVANCCVDWTSQAVLQRSTAQPWCRPYKHREKRILEGCFSGLTPVCYANSRFLPSSFRIIIQIDFSPHHQHYSWRAPSSGIYAEEETSMKAGVRQSWFPARLILRPWRWRWHIPPKSPLTFNGLHAVIFQKIVLFITTAVRTSNPTTLHLI